MKRGKSEVLGTASCSQLRAHLLMPYKLVKIPAGQKATAGGWALAEHSKMSIVPFIIWTDTAHIFSLKGY